jgi:hypothetical protein
MVGIVVGVVAVVVGGEGRGFLAGGGMRVSCGLGRLEEVVVVMGSFMVVGWVVGCFDAGAGGFAAGRWEGCLPWAFFGLDWAEGMVVDVVRSCGSVEVVVRSFEKVMR